ncbi:glycosyltransferase involved in cell wall biosynthesis [Salegentibacter sp. 24]|nr:glycosyltransferase involved in cell wall biosynthesis [Salegentibacter sp. 24]
MEPLVSIIIPTYNRAHLIGDTIGSVITQSYSNWECLIVDDGSNDYTEELLKFYSERDGRIEFHKRPKDIPKGANACRNYGFELSKGEFVNWFDDDDVMLPEFLQKKVKKFEKLKKLVICSGIFTNEFLKKTGRMKIIQDERIFHNYLLWHSQIITNSVMFRRSYLVGTKLFDESLSRGQEAEFFSRIFYSLKRNEYDLIPYGLFLYRQHADTKTEKNKDYIPSFKSSQTSVILKNFQRSLSLKDRVLINYLYAELIELFSQGIKNHHDSNSFRILFFLIPEVLLYNLKLSAELLLYGVIAILKKKISFETYKRLKRNIIK